MIRVTFYDHAGTVEFEADAWGPAQCPGDEILFKAGKRVAQVRGFQHIELVADVTES